MIQHYIMPIYFFTLKNPFSGSKVKLVIHNKSLYIETNSKQHHESVPACKEDNIKQCISRSQKKYLK